jgi:glycerophosphoryl diester phosphodiesterase
LYRGNNLIKKTIHKEKLLSHRLRGFSEIEHTKSALIHALESEVPYIEIDTRVSKDGQIYIHHDSSGNFIEGKVRICEQNEGSIKSLHYKNGESILLLSDLLATFTDKAAPHQILCIDIKDNGFESDHLDLVRRLDLESRVIFISWIPQTLKRLKELGATSPLFLSHLNLKKFSSLGNFIHSVLKKRIIRISQYVMIGSERMESPLNGLKHGFQHSSICMDLPEKYIRILGEHDGGIGVPTRLVCPTLIDYAANNGLRLMAFSVNNLNDYLKYSAMDGLDIVFCDNAPKVLDELKEY